MILLKEMAIYCLYFNNNEKNNNNFFNIDYTIINSIYFFNYTKLKFYIILNIKKIIVI